LEGPGESGAGDTRLKVNLRERGDTSRSSRARVREGEERREREAGRVRESRTRVSQEEKDIYGEDDRFIKANPRDKVT
jgi:hypothetical protein